MQIDRYLELKTKMLLTKLIIECRLRTGAGQRIICLSWVKVPIQEIPKLVSNDA